jgi:polar amino acid transport system substrate-binding protein
MGKFFWILSVIVSLGTGLAKTAAADVTQNKGAESITLSADTESGAPFIFYDPNDPAKLTGFEWDIWGAIARILKVQTRFCQNDWDTLIPGLQRDVCRVAINGIDEKDISENKRKIVATSIPYYITSLRLAVRKNETRIHSLADCREKTIGTFKKSTVVENLLRSVDGVVIKSYGDEINAYSDLENGRLDAVLFDFPSALYYSAANPRVRLLQEDIGKLRYVILVRAEDLALRDSINQALETLKTTGKWRAILERWNLWNADMTQYLNDSSVTKAQPVEYEKFLSALQKQRSWQGKMLLYAKFLPALGRAAVKTMEISLFAMLIAIGLGLMIAVAHEYGPRPVKILSTIYVETVRGTPLLIQILFVFYGLPLIGQALPEKWQFFQGLFNLSPFLAGVIALGINYSAYEAENYRAGLMSIPDGQIEAAQALGMTHFQGLRYVIIPQAFRLVVPPVTNDFISLIKDSSLVSIITIVELTKTYQQLATTYYDYFGTGLLVAALYLLLGLPFVRISKWVEGRLSLERKRKRK